MDLLWITSSDDVSDGVASDTSDNASSDVSNAVLILQSGGA
jgi:hypothetical protein